MTTRSKASPLRREEGVVVRFIEFMPLKKAAVDTRNRVTLKEIVDRIAEPCLS